MKDPFPRGRVWAAYLLADQTDADAMVGATMLRAYGFSPLDRVLWAEQEGLAAVRRIRPHLIGDECGECGRVAGTHRYDCRSA